MFDILVPGDPGPGSLGEICVEDCEEEHGCCCDCDGCPGGTFAEVIGPVPPPMFGPRRGGLLDLMRQNYVNSLERMLYDT